MRWSLSFKLLVIALAVGLLVFGVTQLPRAPVDVLPEYAPTYVEVQTEALGLSADEVEQFITVPLEVDLLSGVAWVESVRSESIAGLSSIVLIFEPGTDPLRARQVVQERLTQAHALPNVSKPPAMIQPLSAASRVLIVGLSTTELSPIELSVQARWNIRPRLMSVPGVANVAIWGQRERQLQVQVDPAQLNAADVTLDQIIRTAGNALWVSPLSYINASTPGSGGFIDTPNQRLGIRHVLPIRSPEDLAKVPVEGSDQRLGDVATVVEDHQPLIGDALAADDAHLLLVVEKLPGVNTLDVTRGLDDALAVMEAGLPGVRIDTDVYRPAAFIESAVDSMALATVAAMVLLFVTIAVLLRGWRSAVIAFVAVVLSLAGGAVALAVSGAGVNALLVAGLALAAAVVIDDAIIGAHDLGERVRRTSAGHAGNGRRELLIEATAAVRRPLVYATVVIVLAVLPLFALSGQTGAFLQPLLGGYLAALAVSMLVAVTVTPVLAMLLLPSSSLPRRPTRVAAALEGKYASALGAVMARPLAVIAAVAVVALVGLATIPLLRQSIVPQFRERDVLVDITATPGTSAPGINRIASQAAAELRALPGVSRVGGHVGRAVLSDTVVGMDAGQLWLTIRPDADYDATLASIRSALTGYPGLELELGTYMTARAGEALTSAPDEVAVRIFGPDLDVLREQANLVREAVAGIPGVSNAQVERHVEEPQVEVEVDIAAATEHGLKPGDIRRQAATLLSGIGVGNLFEDQKVFEVVVWGVPEVRHSITGIRDLLIDTPEGEQVRLGEVADVRVAATPSVIRREQISRRIEVQATLAGRDRSAVVADIESALGSVPFPSEYHPEVVDRSAAGDLSATLGAAALAALIGMLLVLQAAFGSWRLALLSLVVLPLSLAGGLLATLLTGGTISIGSAVGLLAVFAIAVRNELSLITHVREREARTLTRGVDLVVRGARERLLGTLATAVATTAALLPLIVLGDRAGLELLRPMAITIIGGLLTATLLNLFVVPAIYGRFRGSPEAETTDVPITLGEPQVAGAS